MKVYYDDYGSGTVFLCEKCYELLTPYQKGSFDMIENNFRSHGELVSGLYHCDHCGCEVQVLNIGVNIGRATYKADDLYFFDRDTDPQTGRVQHIKAELDLFNNETGVELYLISIRSTSEHAYGEVIELLLSDIKNELRYMGVERFDDTLDDVFNSPVYEGENEELIQVFNTMFI